VFSDKHHSGKLAKSAIAFTTAFTMASILAATAHASDVTVPKMVLTAYVNGAGGESVLAGKYDEALAEIRRTRSVSSETYTAKINNQCVTYAALKQIVQALSACDEALRAAKYDRMTAQSLGAARTQNSYIAIAYTNRAIVHMLAKNAEAAKSDMAHARSLAPSAEFVSQNLLAMQTSASQIAQANVAPTR